MGATGRKVTHSGSSTGVHKVKQLFVGGGEGGGSPSGAVVVSCHSNRQIAASSSSSIINAASYDKWDEWEYIVLVYTQNYSNL